MKVPLESYKALYRCHPPLKGVMSFFFFMRILEGISVLSHFYLIMHFPFLIQDFHTVICALFFLYLFWYNYLLRGLYTFLTSVRIGIFSEENIYNTYFETGISKL